VAAAKGPLPFYGTTNRSHERQVREKDREIHTGCREKEGERGRKREKEIEGQREGERRYMV